MIDLIALSLPSALVSCATVPPLVNSDHLGIHLQMYWRPPPQQSKISSTQVFWRYLSAEWEKANCRLSLINWESLLDATDINIAWCNWKETFLSVMNEYIPKVSLSSNRTKRPWLSKDLLKEIRKRNSLYRQAKSSGDFSNYKRQRNWVVSQLRLATKAYFPNIDFSSPQDFWKFCKPLTRSSGASIPVLSDPNSGKTAVSSKEKADL